MELEEGDWNDTTVIITTQLGIRHEKVVGKEFTGSYQDFFAAVERGDVESAKHGLEAGADPNRTNWMNMTVLHEASERGYAEIVDLLISFGADIFKPAVDQKSCLHLACEKGHFMAASALINAGANIKAKDRSGDTPLHCAVKKNRPALVALLLAQDKSIINLSNRQGKKPTDFPSGGDVRKLLSGEIEDPVYYSSAIFASFDNEDWDTIQMQLSDESGDSGSSGSGEDSSDEEMG